MSRESRPKRRSESTESRDAVAAFQVAPSVDLTDLSLGITDVTSFRKRIRINRLLPKNVSNSKNLEEQRELVLEKRNGRDDILPYYMLELGTKAGCAVCKIELADGSTATGFLVSDDLLLTNHHVLQTVEQAQQARCVFGYELSSDRVPKETSGFRLDPSSLFITSPRTLRRKNQGLDEPDGFDYTLVRIDKSAGARFGRVRLSRGSSKIMRGDPVNLIHHPNGQYKSVTVQDNRLECDKEVLLQYLSDADEGSSGAPVFNNSWDVVGLHVGAGKAPEGTVDMRGDPADYLNVAVKLSAVATDLERRTQNESDRASAVAALSAFQDTDSLLGYFGGLGRRTDTTAPPQVQVAQLYAGSAGDLDIGFINATHLASLDQDQVRRLAILLADLKLDVFLLVGSSLSAAEKVAEELSQKWKMPFVAGSMQEGAADQSSEIALWNTATVSREGGLTWPDDAGALFRASARDLGSPGFEGPLFDRIPSRFRFVLKGSSPRSACEIISFWLGHDNLPSAKQTVAARALAITLQKLSDSSANIIVGGRFNSKVAHGQLSSVFSESSTLSFAAEDQSGGAAVFVRKSESPIGRVWLPSTLGVTAGAVDLTALAPGRPMLASMQGSADYRPLLLRLSIMDDTTTANQEPQPTISPELLAELLGRGPVLSG